MAKVRFEVDGQVAIITLCDPPLNLVGREMADELDGAIAEAERATDARALLVRAEGDNFTAGANVREMFKDVSEAEARQRFDRFKALVDRTERLPYPSVAAVNGLCLAAGLEIIVALDIIWAGTSAQFGFVEPLIGLTPVAGGAYRLAARAGSGRALESVYTARLYDAETFERWNVVNRIVPDDALQEKALEFARRLAAGPTRAYAATKRLMHAYRDEGTPAADALSPQLCAPLFETDDMKHGVDSLLEHGPGKAVFAGR